LLLRKAESLLLPRQSYKACGFGEVLQCAL
jgi:hypothetical protein